MILTAAPYRVSFLGGGTDYPNWVNQHGGAVLSTSIKRYCYIQCRFLPSFFEHKHRIVWSKIEVTRDIAKIEHPVVRAALQEMNIEQGIEIHHTGDLPARGGMGSSSSFAVGLLLALTKLRGGSISKKALADKAIHLEQTVMKEAVGSQDQIATSYGGLNLIEFKKEGGFQVSPIALSSERYNKLFDHLVLLYTGVSRFSSDYAARQIKAMARKEDVLHQMRSFVTEGVDILRSTKRDLNEFGKIIHQSWLLKKSIDPSISIKLIDDLYEKALRNGAIGGKMLGAGGGGFMLFFVHPSKQERFLSCFKDYICMPLRGENKGAHVVFSSDIDAS